MKANELMIGDWVIAYGKKTQVVWVGNIHKLAVRGFPSEFYEDEIEPIPLTLEILEKNGFTKSTPPPGIHAMPSSSKGRRNSTRRKRRAQRSKQPATSTNSRVRKPRRKSPQLKRHKLKSSKHTRPCATRPSS